MVDYPIPGDDQVGYTEGFENRRPTGVRMGAKYPPDHWKQDTLPTDIKTTSFSPRRQVRMEDLAEELSGWVSWAKRE